MEIRDMKRYSKPLGDLLEFKQDFFSANNLKLEEFKTIANYYRSQPIRLACKNCAQYLEFSIANCFTKLGVKYAFCLNCGHCNGAHEDTTEFCKRLYTESSGKNYSSNYTAKDIDQYKHRTKEIYHPKAEFLRDALMEAGHFPARLCDFGAGAGYFVSASCDFNFSEVIGYEVSKALVKFGNDMMGRKLLIQHALKDIVDLLSACDKEVVSFVGVLEHLRSPREALQALNENKRVQYLFFSVPLFSPSVVLESVFPEVMPRHLVAGHTHLYTEKSIDHLCYEFGFERLSEWWFGLDLTDLYRSVTVMIGKNEGNFNSPLREYWESHFLPLVDKLQGVLDEAQACSEVHILVKKTR